MSYKIISSGAKFPVLLNGTVEVGDVISHNGTGFVQADCNLAAGPLPGMAFALESGVSGETAMASKEIVIDTTGLTANGNVYLSGTAGGITQTMPTGVDDLVQLLGRAESTAVAHLRCNPRLEQVVVPLVYLIEATAAVLAASSGSNFFGVTLAAVSDAIHANTRVPRHAFSLVAASLYFSGDVALDASDTYTISVAAAHDGDADVTYTDSISATALTTGNDTIDEDDVSAAFNAAGIIEPGKLLGIDITKAAEGSGGDDPVMFVVALTFLVY